MEMEYGTDDVLNSFGFEDEPQAEGSGEGLMLKQVASAEPGQFKQMANADAVPHAALAAAAERENPYPHAGARAALGAERNRSRKNEEKNGQNCWNKARNYFMSKIDDPVLRDMLAKLYQLTEQMKQKSDVKEQRRQLVQMQRSGVLPEEYQECVQNDPGMVRMGHEEDIKDRMKEAVAEKCGNIKEAVAGRLKDASCMLSGMFGAGRKVAQERQQSQELADDSVRLRPGAGMPGRAGMMG